MIEDLQAREAIQDIQIATMIILALQSGDKK
jgi:hypothetical protein